MIRNQIYLTEEHVEKLKQTTKETGANKSEIVRRSLDKYFVTKNKGKQYRVVEENKKTNVRVCSTWFKTRDKAQQMLDSLGKKKSNTVYYIENGG